MDGMDGESTDASRIGEPQTPDKRETRTPGGIGKQ